MYTKKLVEQKLFCFWIMAKFVLFTIYKIRRKKKMNKNFLGHSKKKIIMFVWDLQIAKQLPLCKVPFWNDSLFMMLLFVFFDLALHFLFWTSAPFVKIDNHSEKVPIKVWMCKNIKTKHIPGAEQTPCMQVRERTRDYIPKYRAILSHYTTGCGNTNAAPGAVRLFFPL